MVLLSVSDDKNHFSMQVVFKGMDKLSVKFEYNADTDTAVEVVNEMIQEQVLPAKYQLLITGEINSILRDVCKPGNDPGLEDKKSGAYRLDSISRHDTLSR